MISISIAHHLLALVIIYSITVSQLSKTCEGFAVMLSRQPVDLKELSSLNINLS